MNIRIPNHVAIIMDGNGRWAQRLNLPSVYGHKKGTEVAKNIVEYASKVGVKYLTLYTFSSENWKRSESEVLGIMSLLKHHITSDRDLIIKNNIKLRVIGNFENLSSDLKQALLKLEKDTASNSGMFLVIALSYGAREEILTATRRITSKVLEEKLLPSEITEEMFTRNMYTYDIPDPDLLIRTGQELRVSNFLLWQIAYTELYFSDVLWPDFSTAYFDDALKEFKRRDRRYGK